MSWCAQLNRTFVAPFVLLSLVELHVNVTKLHVIKFVMVQSKGNSLVVLSNFVTLLESSSKKNQIHLTSRKYLSLIV